MVSSAVNIGKPDWKQLTSQDSFRATTSDRSLTLDKPSFSLDDVNYINGDLILFIA